MAEEHAEEMRRYGDRLPPLVVVCANCNKPSPRDRVCSCGSVVKSWAEETKRGTYTRLRRPSDLRSHLHTRR